MQQVNNPVSEAQQDQDFRQLATLLEKRSQKRPDDMMNAYMLGTLYLRLENYPDAARVFPRMTRHLDNAADKVMVQKLLARIARPATGGDGHFEVATDVFTLADARDTINLTIGQMP